MKVTEQSILPVLAGLQPYEWLTLMGVLIGPILAVLISLWLEDRRKTRDQKVAILRALLTTRHLVGDPRYSVAINLIPIEFAGEAGVQTAYREFIEAASVVPVEATRERAFEHTRVKQTRLIYAVATSIGYKIAETDIQTTAYAAEALIIRDNIALDSQKAMRDLVNVLILQTRLMASGPLTPDERQALKLPEADS